jgi:hypothetical protein
MMEEKMYRILEDVRENSPNPGEYKKMHENLQDKREYAPNSTGRKEKCIQP